MADSLSNAPHPLLHGGTSQNQRTLSAQAPSYVRIDERSETDLLELVYQLARTVVYHEVDNDRLRKSDWQDFFRLSVPVQLALISKFDTEVLRSNFNTALENFESGLGRGNVDTLFDRVFDLARLLDRWHQNLPATTPLHTDLQNLLTNDLRHTLRTLVATANEAEQTLRDPAGNPEYYRPKNLSPFLQNAAWQFSILDQFEAGIPVDGAPARAKGTIGEKRSYYRDRIAELFQAFWQGVERIVKAASTAEYREKSLRDIADHQPYLGLLFAFVRLFKVVQDDLNQLGEKHLDYYLREVLGLKAKPAVPDQAHLVIELDKLTRKHQLLPGLQFKASGKDSQRAEMRYALEREAVLNQTQVKELRTLYRDQPGVGLQSIRSAGKANSFDGEGAGFEDPTQATWKTLGALNAKKPGTTNPLARIGFLIASPVLLLQEGNGTVEIYLDFGTAINATITTTANLAVLKSLFHIAYSGKKGWQPVLDPTFSVVGSPPVGIAAGSLKVEFQLKPGSEPITYPDAKALGADYGIAEPMLKFELTEPKTTAGNWTLYDTLRKLTVQGIAVQVKDVEVKKLLLSNEEGPVDPNKPFLPFGAVPHVGSEFIIGSDEAFKKPLTTLKLNILWDKIDFDSFDNYYRFYSDPHNNADFKATIYRITHGVWSKSHENELLFIDSVNGFAKDKIKTITLSGDSLVPIKESLVPYTNQTQNGFVKIELRPNDFGHDEYPKLLADLLIAKAASGDSEPVTYLEEVETAVQNASVSLADCNTRIGTIKSAVDTARDKIDAFLNSEKSLPNPPYTPTIKSFSLQYTALSTWTANSPSDLQFAHLHPFEANNHEKQTVIGAFNLLPAFTAEGALYLGLEKLMPGSTLNLLFQMAEATANPDVATKGLAWAYLIDNKWEPLDPEFELRLDDTHGLIASGIVELTVPFDISAVKTTILPASLHWLRVSLDQGVAGVSELAAVHAQAIKIAFAIQPENDTERLNDPLPAESITKPVVDDAALKKIQQPYASFGGRPAEDAVAFRRRAGEHLRHKGRAVSLNDYERLVLERFPQLYKVKCLTHTHIFQNTKGKVQDFYLTPGHVALAVIPDITRFQFAEKLRPKASRALLTEIGDYLRTICSPFVKIHVVNPQFQPVRVEADVVLKKGKDLEYYKAQLKQDLLHFFTPWAFGELGRLSFGGRTFQSSALHFVEKLDYVDYVLQFNLVDEETHTAQTIINARTERSIIASGTHVINTFYNPAPTINQKDPSKVGLGYQLIP